MSRKKKAVIRIRSFAYVLYFLFYNNFRVEVTNVIRCNIDSYCLLIAHDQGVIKFDIIINTYIVMISFTFMVIMRY